LNRFKIFKRTRSLILPSLNKNGTSHASTVSVTYLRRHCCCTHQQPHLGQALLHIRSPVLGRHCYCTRVRSLILSRPFVHFNWWWISSVAGDKVNQCLKMK
jgi:hypothetical protein